MATKEFISSTNEADSGYAAGSQATECVSPTPSIMLAACSYTYILHNKHMLLLLALSYWALHAVIFFFSSSVLSLCDCKAITKIKRLHTHTHTWRRKQAAAFYSTQHNKVEKSAFHDVFVAPRSACKSAG